MKSTCLKWPGGKAPLAGRILALFPPRRSAECPGGWLHYVEPYAGALGVLMAQDPEGISEVVNDLDGHLVNLWRCLACPLSFEMFRRQAEAVPFCEALYAEAAERVSRPCEAPGSVCVGCALAFFVACRQSLAGRMEGFATLSRRRTRRGMNEQASAWLSAVEGLAAVHERLRRVVILNRDALEVIRTQDGPATLTYADPPYLPETRTVPDQYRHEMTFEQHERLLDALLACEGKVVLSGYPNGLYDARLAGWRRVDTNVPNHAAGGKSKRRMVERLWLNYDPPGEGP